MLSDALARQTGVYLVRSTSSQIAPLQVPQSVFAAPALCFYGLGELGSATTDCKTSSGPVCFLSHFQDGDVIFKCAHIPHLVPDAEWSTAEVRDSHKDTAIGDRWSGTERIY